MGGRTGRVLCDRKMNVDIRRKVFRTMVRPTLVFGAETLALKKGLDKKLDVAEMRMLTAMDVRSYEAGQDQT